MRRHSGGGRIRPGVRAPRRKRETAPIRGARPKGLIWTGALSFGLVNIPVTLHSGENAESLHFTMLDSRDLSPVGYRKVNKTTGAEVPRERIVKGYRYGEDEYVTLSQDDFKRASPERSQRIDILAFVDGKSISPPYFDKPYYLEPSAKSDKAYALLREAMRKSGKVAIATLVLRARQYVAAVMVQGRALTLELLRYRCELRDPAELHLPDEDTRRLGISQAELDMAERLIADLSGPWKPESYKDEYRDELLAFIEKKIKAGKGAAGPHVPAPDRLSAPPADIMSLLKKSLAKSGPARRDSRED